MRAGDDNAITVSYGSFSVTLSGHENPFEMLKQITDYYSILAQTNPNFGAIPTAPPAELTVETVSAPVPEKKLEPVENTGNKPEKFVLQPDQTDNLWQEPIPEYHATPLVLEEPVTAAQAGEEALIAAASQALETPEIPAPREQAVQKPKSQFLTSNYPFRHFPLRRPGRR
jgi:hypothetical protein